MMSQISSRDLTAVAIGIAAGVVASRLLAPVAAARYGAVRAHLGADPFETLTQDHRTILSQLREMENSEPSMKSFLRVKRALAKHAMAEEDAVYPLICEETFSRQQAEHLYAEHGEMKMLLYRIENCVRRKSDWREPVTKLRDMIERHAREEEEVEFPKLRAALAESQRKELSMQIEREEALVL